MELDFDKLRGLRVLGRGAMGTVFLVEAISSDNNCYNEESPPSSSCTPPFALKVVNKQSASKHDSIDRRARWEVSVLSRLSHPFLPTLIGSIETLDFIAWALPFYSGGDLNKLRHSLPERSLSPSALRFYLSEVVTALSHLHSLGIVYRDLKPENLLLRADGHLILSDFDLSRNLSPRQKICPCSDDASSKPVFSPETPRNVRRRRNLTRIFFPSSTAASTAAAAAELKKAKSARVSPATRRQNLYANGERSFSFVGTEEYVAPEVVRGDGHEYSVDWWALGILAYELAFGIAPFKGRDRKETFRNVLTKQLNFAGSGKRKKTDIEDLISKLLIKDPERRLGYSGGADEVMAHPFFKGVKWELLEDVARPPYFPDYDGEDFSEDTGQGFDIRDYFKNLRQREKLSLPEKVDEF